MVTPKCAMVTPNVQWSLQIRACGLGQFPLSFLRFWSWKCGCNGHSGFGVTIALEVQWSLQNVQWSLQMCNGHSGFPSPPLGNTPGNTGRPRRAGIGLLRPGLSPIHALLAGPQSVPGHCRALGGRLLRPGSPRPTSTPFVCTYTRVRLGARGTPISAQPVYTRAHVQALSKNPYCATYSYEHLGHMFICSPGRTGHPAAMSTHCLYLVYPLPPNLPVCRHPTIHSFRILRIPIQGPYNLAVHFCVFYLSLGTLKILNPP